MYGPGLALVFLAFICVPVYACTIFVLTDASRALFFNNEDWSNPNTRIWFVPVGEGHYGCAYVGFDNGWAQGGLNTEGLVFDWVSGYNEKWEPDSGMRSVRGNPSERMMETCATVGDAIAFYRKHREPDFSRSKILVADRTGPSVIIGAKDGRLQVEKANQCRGFGYGSQTLDRMLMNAPEPTVANGVKILRACLQKGQYATKYSSVFDLKSGDIFLFQFPDRDDDVKLNLAVELKKGGHYYDMPQIREQMSRGPLPLLNNMKRFLLDEFKSIPDKEPKVTTRIRAMIQDVFGGTMRAGDYAADLWKELASKQKEIQADLQGLGDFVSVTLVDRRDEDGRPSYRYRMEFKKATVLQYFLFDEQNKVVSSRSEGLEWKPGAR